MSIASKSNLGTHLAMGHVHTGLQIFGSGDLDDHTGLFFSMYHLSMS
jgi:hypothetical protein